MVDISSAVSNVVPGRQVHLIGATSNSGLARHIGNAPAGVADRAVYAVAAGDSGF